jgi:WhiB family transcriptional regulator, redox-sensing transcriptional regulator
MNKVPCSVDPVIFFPIEGVTRVKKLFAPYVYPDDAKAVCGTCPVRQRCLDTCLEIERVHGRQAGVWGGTSEVERERVNRRRGVRRSLSVVGQLELELA